MASLTFALSDSPLSNVVHDLRQPLDTIGASAYVLSLLLRDAPPHVQEQLRIIERQVGLAAHILEEAVNPRAVPRVAAAAVAY